MRCYYHSDREAVAICRTCGKALCYECLDADKKSMYIYCRGSSRCKKYEQYTRKMLERKSGFIANAFRFLLIAAAIFIVGYGISLIMPPAPLPPIPGGAIPGE